MRTFALQWDDIYGDSVMNAIAFSGGNYIHEPPTNMTATPKIKNITVQNVRLTNVEGAYQGISTLPESPIDGLYLRNISFTMAKVHRASWTCQAGCSGELTAKCQCNWSERCHCVMTERYHCCVSQVQEQQAVSTGSLPAVWLRMSRRRCRRNASSARRRHRRHQRHRHQPCTAR